MCVRVIIRDLLAYGSNITRQIYRDTPRLVRIGGGRRKKITKSGGGLSDHGVSLVVAIQMLGNSCIWYSQLQPGVDSYYFCLYRAL